MSQLVPYLQRRPIHLSFFFHANYHISPWWWTCCFRNVGSNSYRRTWYAADLAVIFKGRRSHELLLFFTSMWWDYFSELWSITGLLFIPQMMYESGQPRWKDVDRGTEEPGEQPAPVPHSSPQIPHGLTRSWNRPSALRCEKCRTELARW
jgi:hypothetical protein